MRASSKKSEPRVRPPEVQDLLERSTKKSKQDGSATTPTGTNQQLSAPIYTAMVIDDVQPPPNQSMPSRLTYKQSLGGFLNYMNEETQALHVRTDGPPKKTDTCSKIRQPMGSISKELGPTAAYENQLFKSRFSPLGGLEEDLLEENQEAQITEETAITYKAKEDGCNNTIILNQTPHDNTQDPRVEVNLHLKSVSLESKLDFDSCAAVCIKSSKLAKIFRLCRKILQLSGGRRKLSGDLEGVGAQRA
nr:hypothetical protein Iba_chr08aCG9440 [Ipomoea batatas]